ncbi:Integrase-like protein y4lS (fragment) [Moritella yayanosii]|uniref:Integrase-like protein y4lS n=1 Tax=Moritella yayanosii TaxID=69539 RepID=A0A330LNF8_9GAMM
MQQPLYFLTLKYIHLSQVAERFQDESINLVVIDQAIDTSTPTGRLMLAAIAEFETDLRSERQLEGIAKAKEHGVKFGWPTKRTDEIDLEIYNKRKESVSIGQLAKYYDLGSATIDRILNNVLEKTPTDTTKL